MHGKCLGLICLSFIVACAPQPAEQVHAVQDARPLSTLESGGPAVRAGLVSVPAQIRSSNAAGFTELDGFALFSASGDLASDAELWRTDGTEAGTQLVADINRGSGGSSPQGFAVIGGVAYFTADDGVHGVELWRSDGTTTGTRLVADISPGVDGSYPTGLTLHDGLLYFTASDPAHGAELWRSDGTTLGTWLVADLSPGTSSSTPYCLSSTPQGLFMGTNAPAGAWRSDGSDAGTTLVDVFAPVYGATPNASCFQALGEAVYYLGGADGTLMRVATGATAAFAGVATRGQDLVQAGGFLYWSGQLAGSAAGEPRDLFAWDGAAEQPITTGGSDPLALRSNGERVLFTASSTASGREPWVAVGPSAHLLADLCTGSCASMASGTIIATAGGRFFLTVGLVGGAYTLYATDGIVAPAVVGSSPSRLSGAGTLGGQLLFLNSDAAGDEPWRSDGTLAGTHRVANIAGDGSMPGYSLFTPTASGVAFMVSDGSVWFTSGVVARKLGAFTSPLIVGSTGDALLIAGYTGSSAYTPYLSVAGAPATRWTAVPSIVRGQGVTLNGILYFAGTDAATGTELWRTDGTAAGTWRVADLNPGSASSTPGGFRLSGNRIYFAATDASHGSEPWVSDGTAAGTSRLGDLFVGGNSVFNAVAEDGRGGLYFSASRAAYDKGLWHTDGTAAGTQRISGVDPGTGRGPARGLAVGDAVFFHGDDGKGMALWRTDGTPSGTWQVAPGTTWPGDLVTLASIDGLVYFTKKDPDLGWELWRTDGSPGMAELVTDLLPGLGHGVGSSFSPLAVPEAGVILFAGDDGIGGLELWATDGTPEGTALVQDLTPGPGYSNPGGFTRAGNSIYFHAAVPGQGRQPWSIPIAAIDRRAPSIGCPSDVVAEATGMAGAAVGYPAAIASDAVTASPVVTYSAPSGSTFPFGESTVAATATDEAGNSSSCSFHVTVRDTSAPAIACPGDVVAEASGPAGAVVSYPVAVATDAVTAAPVVTYSLASGSRFPLGESTIIATATDEAGNSSSCSFHVTVRDTSAPAIACPGDVVAEASGPAGAAVSYPVAIATDAVTGAPALTYSLGSGAIFPLGQSTVLVRATDEAGNSSSCSFHVTVADSKAPVLTCPAPISVKKQNKLGAVVTYPAPTAIDAVTPKPTVTATPASGSLFPVGTTLVSASARDAAGNVGECSFVIEVRH